MTEANSTMRFAPASEFRPVVVNKVVIDFPSYMEVDNFDALCELATRLFNGVVGQFDNLFRLPTVTLWGEQANQVHIDLTAPQDEKFTVELDIAAYFADPGNQRLLAARDEAIGFNLWSILLRYHLYLLTLVGREEIAEDRNVRYLSIVQDWKHYVTSIPPAQRSSVILDLQDNNWPLGGPERKFIWYLLSKMSDSCHIMLASGADCIWQVLATSETNWQGPDWVALSGAIDRKMLLSIAQPGFHSYYNECLVLMIVNSVWTEVEDDPVPCIHSC